MKNWPGLSYVPSFTYTDDRTTRLRQSLKYLYSISTNKIHQNRFSGPILEEEIKTYNLFSHDHSGPCTLNDLPILPGPKLHRNWTIFFPSIIGPLKSTYHHQRPLFWHDYIAQTVYYIRQLISILPSTLQTQSYGITNERGIQSQNKRLAILSTFH